MKLERIASINRRPAGLLPFLLVIIVSGCFARVNAAALSGRVTDQNGDPLAATQITAHKLGGNSHDSSAKSDADGRFAFELLPDGNYLVTAVHPGFSSVSIDTVVIAFPLQVTWNPLLRVAELGLEGTLSSDLIGELTIGGRPISGATVCLSAELRRVCTRTNELGQYFLAVPPGRYMVSVSGPDGPKIQSTLDMTSAGIYRDKIHPGPNDH